MKYSKYVVCLGLILITALCFSIVQPGYAKPFVTADVVPPTPTPSPGPTPTPAPKPPERQCLWIPLNFDPPVNPPQGRCILSKPTFTFVGTLSCAQCAEDCARLEINPDPPMEPCAAVE